MLVAAITAREVAEAIRGEIHGPNDVKLTGIQPLELAKGSDLSFFAPTSKRKTSELLSLARASSAGALLVPAYDEQIRTTQIVTPHPLAALTELVRHFYQAPRPDVGIHPSAVVHPTAKLGNGVSVGAYTVIGAEVTIGDNAIIHPHVVIYPGVKIGAGTVVHSGAVLREFVRVGSECTIQNGAIIGGDGFGYFRDPIVGHRHIPHIGTVVLENRVDVGANSTIDRATFGETRVRESAKIDNLVTVGHNVSVGRRTLLCGQVGISGSARIGNDVVLGGQVGVADHVKIVDGARCGGQTGVIIDIEKRADYLGNPPREARAWQREQLMIQKLPEFSSLLRKLVKAVGIS